MPSPILHLEAISYGVLSLLSVAYIQQLILSTPAVRFHLHISGAMILFYIIHLYNATNPKVNKPMAKTSKNQERIVVIILCCFDCFSLIIIISSNVFFAFCSLFIFSPYKYLFILSSETSPIFSPDCLYFNRL